MLEHYLSIKENTTLQDWLLDPHEDLQAWASRKATNEFVEINQEYEGKRNEDD